MADIALHDLGGEARAREIVPQAREALCARIDGGDVPSRRGELHRLAARCGAQVEDAASLAIAQKARRKAGREILHPPAARAEAWHRSEEHTSELPSLMRISYALFCLKKNK